MMSDARSKRHPVRFPPPSCPPAKVALSSILARTPLTRVVKAFEARWPFTRVLVYHGTPARLRAHLGRQLDYLLERYRGIRGDELEDVLRNGPGPRAGVVFTFDDGLANNYEIAAPLLEERGLRGIFCIPAAFPSVPRSEQPRWFMEHVRSSLNSEHETEEDMLAMTWDQVRDLVARGHRICSHSLSHSQITAQATADELRAEIIGSKELLRDQLGPAEVDGFCWPIAPDPFADGAHDMMRSNYRYILAGGCRPLFRGHDPHAVYRTNVEASWPREVVDLQLSGIIDLKFAIGSAQRSIAWKLAGGR